MDIILAGYEIPVDILEKSNCISQHTGLELERIKVNANIEGEEINEKIIDYLGTAREEGINSKEGQITRKWKLGNYSTSYSDNKECVNYSLELEEIEEIKLDRLILDDLELIPTQYREHIGFDDSFSADVRVLLSDTQFKRVKELMRKSMEGEPTIVTRKGINETPRRMDLILDGWSKDERGIKCQFSLNDQKDAKVLNPFRAIWRGVDLVIKQGQLIEQLANLLIQKNILKKEEFDSIKSGIPRRNQDIELELYKEKDLDEWEFR